jgi:ATP phosphoribosyltransferase regulatory subunit
VPELRECLANWQLDPAVADMLLALVELNGDIHILHQAKTELAAATVEVHTAIDELEELARLVEQHDSAITLHFDLAELRGYHYHTGLMFAAYAEGHGASLAQGGRYDDIGKVFGSGRPATGFSLDIKSLTTLRTPANNTLTGIMAPALDDADLRTKIASLRQQGERVVCGLPGEECAAQQLGCDRELRCVDGNWIVNPVA